MSGDSSSDEKRQSDSAEPTGDPAPEAGTSGTTENGSMISDLIRRRVPQVLAGYLGVTWTLFELMQWLTNNYLISPYLGRVVLFGLLMMVPAVVLVTYRHGRPGPDHWTSLERWGTAGNVLLALLVLGFSYGDAELGSMVKRVRARPSADTTDDASSVTTRKVPKKEFRKRVALFYFDEAEGTKADTALRRAVPNAVYWDLDQDNFISTRFDDWHSEDLQERNYESGLGVPLALKREIAQEEGSEYILSGTIGRTEDGFRLTTNLYKTQTGEQLADRSFNGDDLFPLVDKATRQLKKDLELPKAHREKVADLPVTQVFTPSLEAAKHYAKGIHLMELGVYGRIEKSYKSYTKAAEKDSTFSLALASRGSNLWAMGKRGEAKKSYRRAERHSYRLTNSSKYFLRSQILQLVENRPESALDVCKRWTKLHPYDLEAWKRKGELYRYQLEYELALKSYKKALDLSPKNKDLYFEVGELLIGAEKNKDAINHFSNYANKNPQDGSAHLMLALSFWRSGQLDSAVKALKKTIQIDPQGLGSPTGSGSAVFARVNQATGRFEKALKIFKEAALSDKSHRSDGYSSWHHQWLRGKIGESIALYDSMRTAKVKRPEFHLYDLGVRACEYYSDSQAEPVRTALSDMRDLHERFDGTIPTYRVMTHTGLASCLVATDSLKTAQYHLNAADSIVGKVKRPNIRNRYDTDYFRGRLHEAADRFEKAANSYQRYLQIRDPYDFLSPSKLGRLPRLRMALSEQRLGRDKEAQKAYQSALDMHPAYPRLNYHYGRFLAQQGKTEKAQEHLGRALKGWAPADSSFAMKQRARTLLDSLDTEAI